MRFRTSTCQSTNFLNAPRICGNNVSRSCKANETCPWIRQFTAIPDFLMANYCTKSQPSQTNRVTLGVTANVLWTKVGAQCDNLATIEVNRQQSCNTANVPWRKSIKLGTHYPCTRAVFTGRVHGPWTRPTKTDVENDTRVHGPWWSPMYPVSSPRSRVKTLNITLVKQLLLKMQNTCCICMCLFMVVARCPPIGWSNIPRVTYESHVRRSVKILVAWCALIHWGSETVLYCRRFLYVKCLKFIS